VSVDEQEAEPADSGPQPGPLSEYVARMRRQRRWYLGAVGVALGVALVVVVVVMATSEISHVQLRTAASAAPEVARGQISAAPKLTWETTDETAIGEPFDRGTIVTYSAHTVTGRNALTGAPTWSYTRTDRTVCTAAQQQSRTLAIFAKDGNCDELTTLDTGTGKRLGVRTLVDNGHPAFTALPDTLLLTTPDTVHAVDPVSGYDRWFFQQPDGCRTAGVALGTGGAVIAQRCADGGHLLLRDRYAGADDKNTQVKWRLGGLDVIPLAVGSAVIALDPATGDLVSYDLDKGAARGRIPLSPRPDAAAPISELSTTTAEVVQIGATTYAITPSGDRVLWTAATRGLPTATTGTIGIGPPALTDAVVLAPSARGVVSLDAFDGLVRHTYPVPAPSNGSRVFPLGTGFLVAGATTKVYQ
jgi:PQQ-like domain